MKRTWKNKLNAVLPSPDLTLRAPYALALLAHKYEDITHIDLMREYNDGRETIGFLCNRAGGGHVVGYYHAETLYEKWIEAGKPAPVTPFEEIPNTA